MNAMRLEQVIDQYSELLTDRQQAVLRLTMLDWTSRQVGDAIGISHTTVLDDLRRSVAILVDATQTAGITVIVELEGTG
jgi:predicted DNA-binding protein YlxM (UPF0122 family)